jgi:hypothetical protein
MAILFDINAIKDDKVWIGVGVSIWMLTLGALACLKIISPEFCLATQASTMAGVYGVKKLVPPKKEGT